MATLKPVAGGRTPSSDCKHPSPATTPPGRAPWGARVRMPDDDSPPPTRRGSLADDVSPPAGVPLRPAAPGTGLWQDTDLLIERVVCARVDGRTPCQRLAAVAESLRPLAQMRLFDRFIHSAAAASLQLDAVDRIALCADAIGGVLARTGTLHTLIDVVGCREGPQRFTHLYALIDHLVQSQPGQSREAILDAARAVAEATLARRPDVAHAVACRLGWHLGLAPGPASQRGAREQQERALSEALFGLPTAGRPVQRLWALQAGLRLAHDPGHVLHLDLDADAIAWSLQAASAHHADLGGRPWQDHARDLLDQPPASPQEQAVREAVRERLQAHDAAQREGGCQAPTGEKRFAK